MKNKNLPSRFIPGNGVNVNFPGHGVLKNCEVAGVHHSDEGKVTYDTHIKLTEGMGETTIYGIDSVFVFPAD